MTLLAIDTATNRCSAAVVVDGVVVASRSEDMLRGHAEALMPMVAAILAEAGLSGPAGVAGLDGIVVTVGPGAFTGVRIGLAAARAMGLAAECPVLGLTTLEVVAADAAPGLPVLVALDSKRADAYVQLFDPGGRPLAGPAALLPDAVLAYLMEAGVDAGDIAIAGDGGRAVTPALTAAGYVVRPADGTGLPDIAVLGRLAAARWIAVAPRLGDSPPSPLYLRPPAATPPRVRPAPRKPG
jgi:tRNA threonylcarbamoyladenosine biosynthesis protein TsaB